MLWTVTRSPSISAHGSMASSARHERSFDGRIWLHPITNATSATANAPNACRRQRQRRANSPIHAASAIRPNSAASSSRTRGVPTGARRIASTHHAETIAIAMPSRIRPKTCVARIRRNPTASATEPLAQGPALSSNGSQCGYRFTAHPSRCSGMLGSLARASSPSMAEHMWMAGVDAAAPLLGLMLAVTLAPGCRQDAEKASRADESVFLPSVENPIPAHGSAPDGMAWIPGGEFSMGAQDPPDGNDEVGMQATTDSRPVHRVFVDGFWMDRTE